MNFLNLMRAILRVLPPYYTDIQYPPQDVLDSYQHQREPWRSLEVDWSSFLAETKALANRYCEEGDEEFEYRLIHACLKNYRYQDKLSAGENVFQFLLYLRISFRLSVQEDTDWQGSAFFLKE
jgi:hypothetical protein